MWYGPCILNGCDLTENKSAIERRNTLGCLYQYTCREFRPWNSRKHEAAQVYKYVQKHSGPSSILGSYGCYVFSLVASLFTLVVEPALWKLKVVAENTIEGLETQPLSPGLFHQSCARLLDAASRVLIRHVVCCGNTVTEPYLVKSFVSKGSETRYLNIPNHISFEAELHLDCSKAL